MVQISEIDGCPILEVNDRSLLGTWCYYLPLSVGNLVTEEFTFTADKSFIWRTLSLTDDDAVRFPRIEGTWSLEGELLKLTLDSWEDPEQWPRERIHFSIRMRERHGQRELVLQSTVCDDQVYEEGSHGFSAFPHEAATDEADNNHAEYEAKRKKKITLDGPFKPLASLLTKAVPAAVAQLQLSEPLFCVRLYFHDTHAPPEDYCCWVRCLTEPARQHVVQHEQPMNVPYELWHPTAGIANELPAGVYEADLTGNAEIMKLYGQIYELLRESEEENVPKLRAALRKASLMLHMIRWPDSVATTDDFVVFPADGSNYYAGEYEEDMRKCIPKKRLDLLTERGYLAWQ